MCYWNYFQSYATVRLFWKKKAGQREQSTEGDFMWISFNPLGVHPWGQIGCQRKQNFVRNLNLLNWCSTFQSKLNKLWKTTRNKQKTSKNDDFLEVFQRSFDFDWKVEHQTKKFEFHELFCFFWHPWCLQGCPPSRDMPCFTFLFEIFWWWRHLPTFLFYWKWRPWTPLFVSVLR